MMDTLKFVTTCNFHFPRQRRETELLEYFPFWAMKLLKLFSFFNPFTPKRGQYLNFSKFPYSFCKMFKEK